MEGKIIKGDPELTEQAFEVYQRIQGNVGEFFDNWMLVGERPDGGRVLIGRNHAKKGWGNMQTVYESGKKWKKDSVGNTN